MFLLVENHFSLFLPCSKTFALFRYVLRSNLLSLVLKLNLFVSTRSIFSFSFLILLRSGSIMTSFTLGTFNFGFSFTGSLILDGAGWGVGFGGSTFGGVSGVIFGGGD